MVLPYLRPPSLRFLSRSVYMSRLNEYLTISSELGMRPLKERVRRQEMLRA